MVRRLMPLVPRRALTCLLLRVNGTQALSEPGSSGSASALALSGGMLAGSGSRYQVIEPMHVSEPCCTPSRALPWTAKRANTHASLGPWRT